MKTVKLNSGYEMPLVGFGVFQIQDPKECEDVTYLAIKNGYRLLDTAVAYCNEQAVGKAVRRAIADGIVKRDELFITTKVWVQDMKGDGMAYASVRRSLELMGLDYLDLVLLHQPIGDYFTAYRDIIRAAEDGLVRSIGVSNFYPEVLTNLCENAEVIPAVNQVELHPFFAQSQAIGNMDHYGIVAQAWGPLAEGRHGIFKHPVLTEIGDRYGKTAAQIALKWNVQRGVSILPKSVHEDRMKQNIDIFDFTLTEKEMEEITALDLGHSEIVDHRDPEFVRMISNWTVNHRGGIMAKTLIAFFSRAGENYFGGSYKYVDIGNTEIAVNMIREMIDADVFKIEMKMPYSEVYNTCIDEAKKDLRSNARPEIGEFGLDMSSYDTVILGYPNYWGTVPMAVMTFLDDVDLSGKRILPLCTNEGSGMGSSERDIRAACPGAELAKGLPINGSRVSGSGKDIRRWLETNGLLRTQWPKHLPPFLNDGRVAG